MRVNISTTVPTNTTVHEVERKKNFLSEKKNSAEGNQEWPQQLPA